MGDQLRHILAVLHSEQFCDAAPVQVWATLLDEGLYLDSQSTFYRLLGTVHGDVTERQSQATPSEGKAGAGRARPEPGLDSDIQPRPSSCSPPTSRR